MYIEGLELLSQAERCQQAGRGHKALFEGARQSFSGAFTKDTQHERAAFQLGIVYTIWVMKPQVAHKWFLKACAIDENYVPAQSNVGLHYFRQHKWAQGIKHLKRAIKVVEGLDKCAVYGLPAVLTAVDILFESMQGMMTIAADHPLSIQNSRESLAAVQAGLRLSINLIEKLDVRDEELELRRHLNAEYQGNIRKSLPLFAQAAQCYHLYSLPDTNLGVFLESCGNVADAIEHFKAAIRKYGTFKQDKSARRIPQFVLDILLAERVHNNGIEQMENAHMHNRESLARLLRQQQSRGEKIAQYRTADARQHPRCTRHARFHPRARHLADAPSRSHPDSRAHLYHG
jgi:tetratricopeptide (TPR) repeat protein